MRVEIAQALFDRLCTAAAFRTTENGRIPTPDQIPGTEQPALFLGIPDEVITFSGDDMAIRVLTFMAFVFVRGDGGNKATAGPDLLAAIDGVEAALAPDDFSDHHEGRCTLKGLVHRARIEGEIVTNEYGTGPAQGVAIIPITVLIP